MTTDVDAVVVRLDGDHVWVRTDSPGHACGGCARRDGCHTPSLLGSVMDGQRSGLLRLPNAIAARPGDAVVVYVPEATMWRAIGLAYGLPLVLALAGMLVAKSLFASDLAAMTGLLLGLFAGWLPMRLTKSRRGELVPSIRFKEPF